MFNLSPVAVPGLEGLTVLVSGAGKGIGAELVRQLDAAGATVFAGIHVPDLVEELPSRARRLDLDVTSQADVDAAIDAVIKHSGKLDVLVNNAATISTIAPLAEVTASGLSRAFEVNVVGAHRLTIAALPYLKASRGKVINAGTGAATTPMEGWTAYCASKAGLQMLTRMMALELSVDGIKAFFLGIPPTDTAMQEKIRESGLNAVSRIPKGELVPVSVPASCMAWLCTPAADEIDEVLLDVRQEVFKRRMRALN